jgi:uncharacterized protein (TIGR03437 family)
MVGSGKTTVSFQITAGPTSVNETVTLVASGPGGSAQAVVTVQQATAPIITAPQSVDGRVTTPIRFGVTASDPHGLPLALTAAALPPGAVFSNGQFTWIPTEDQTGTFTVAVTATTSNGQTSTATISIRVIGKAVLNALVNAASFAQGDVCSPGSWVSAFGKSLVVGDPRSADTVPLGTVLGGSQVKVNTTGAPLLYVSGSLINFQCPLLEPGTAIQVKVEVDGGGSTTAISGTMQAATPGLFTLNSSGSGQGAVLIANTNLLAMPNTDGIPSRPGVKTVDYLSIFANGFGATQETVPAGTPAPLDHLVLMTNKVRVFLGGVRIDPAFAGLAPGAIGLYQINVPILLEVPAGAAVPLHLEIELPDGTVLTTNEVTVAIDEAPPPQ